MSASDWLASLLWAKNQEVQAKVDYRSSILTLLLFSLKFSWFLSPFPPPSPRLERLFLYLWQKMVFMSKPLTFLLFITSWCFALYYGKTQLRIAKFFSLWSLAFQEYCLIMDHPLTSALINKIKQWVPLFLACLLTLEALANALAIICWAELLGGVGSN